MFENQILYLTIIQHWNPMRMYDYILHINLNNFHYLVFLALQNKVDLCSYCYTIISSKKSIKTQNGIVGCMIIAFTNSTTQQDPVNQCTLETNKRKIHCTYYTNLVLWKANAFSTYGNLVHETI